MRARYRGCKVLCVGTVLALAAGSAFANVCGTWSRNWERNVGNSDAGGRAYAYAYVQVQTLQHTRPAYARGYGSANLRLFGSNLRVAQGSMRAEVRNDQFRSWGEVDVRGASGLFTIWSYDRTQDLFASDSRSWSRTRTFFNKSKTFPVAGYPINVYGTVSGIPRANSYAYASISQLSFRGGISGQVDATAKISSGIPWLAEGGVGITAELAKTTLSGTVRTRFGTTCTPGSLANSGTLDVSFRPYTLDFFVWLRVVGIRYTHTVADYSGNTLNRNLISF